MCQFCGKEIHEAVIRDCFSHYGLENWKHWDVSHFNLIIGENGMGKSRLLLAVRELCKNEKITCLYIDFTKIQGKLNDKNQTPRNLADTLLYLGTMPDDAFYNFIPFLENNLVSFSEYLNRLSQDQLEMVMGERRKNINHFLLKHLGRQLVFEGKDGKCMISYREVDKEPLPFLDAVNEMSPGERCILYFALGILCVEADRRCSGNYVLLLDEPENHLHTKALLGLANDLKSRAIAQNSHIVIASHSVFLIPLFRFNEIRLMENGKIRKPKASLYQDAFDTLIGNTNAGGGNLQEFLSSIYHWNFCNYLTECLCEPTTVERATKNDPQLKKLIEQLSKLKQRNQIKLLDYGGGSGRIAKCLQLYFLDNPTSVLRQKLTYDIYDPAPEYHDLPKEVWMGNAYDETTRTLLSEKQYDIVVVYNVLHEVDITEWENTLNRILQLLRDDGILVFGERMVLSQGERPYGKSGYLVLGKEELSIMFGKTNVSVIILPKESNQLNGNRVTRASDPTECCAIISPRVIKITDVTIKEALEHLSKRSKDAVISAMDGGPVKNPPRQYAFYCQQYINAEHALELLEKA